MTSNGEKIVRMSLLQSQSATAKQVNSALPGRQWSVLGASAVFGAWVVFQCSPAPFSGAAVLLVFSTWAAIKVHMVANFCLGVPADSDSDSDSSSEGCSAASSLLYQGEPVNCLQRVFRSYYLFDQSVSPVPRAIAWFCFVAMVLMATSHLQPFAHPFSCFSHSCCVAAEAAGWDMSLVVCHDDRIIVSTLFGQNSSEHRCSSHSEKLMQKMCRAASGTGWWEHGYGFGVAVVVWVFVFLKRLVFLACVPLPEKPTKWVNDPSFLGRIGAIIPCHQSEAEIANTCRSIMRYLPPQNIVVADNANSVHPPDETRAVVKAVDPDITYLFIQRGLKTLALYNGMLQLPQHVEYILHVDDDTVLPEDMVFDEKWFEDASVAEVTYPFFPREENLLTSCIGLIFRLNFHMSYFANVTSGTSLWAPGIVGLVRRSAFMKVFPDHVFLPFGEDAFLGTLLLANNWKIKRDMRSNVVTFAPPVFFTPCASSSREQGYGATSLFKQRAQRWMVTQLRRMTWTFLLLFTFRAGSLWSNIWFRIMTVQAPIATLISLLATPWAIVTALSHQGLLVWFPFVLRAWTVYYVGSVLQLLVINYCFWRHRPDYQIRWTTILFTPVVNTFISLCRPVGHALSVFYWIPFVPTRVHVFTHGSSSGEASQPMIVS